MAVLRQKRASAHPAVIGQVDVRTPARSVHGILHAERWALAGLVLALVLGAVLRIWLSWTDDGLYWPDEIYMSVEPAHRLVFGYGLFAWEFVRGARNWTLPGLVAGVMKLSTLLGLEEPRQYLTVIRLVFSGVGIATAVSTYLLARSLRASVLPAACGAALFALLAPAVYLGPRALGETASALPVVLGLAFALRTPARRWERLLGAALLGFAVLLRLQNALFCLGLLGFLLAGRRRRDAFEACLVFGACAALFGLIDLVSWGRWFGSANVYLRFNLVEGRSAMFGTAPLSYYAQVLWTSMPLPAVVIIGLAAVAVTRSRALVLMAAALVIVHSAIPHKEFRFIFPALPLLCALAGVGADELGRRWSPQLALVGCTALLVSALWSGATFHALTFGDLGQHEDVLPRSSTTDTSAYDNVGPENRLLMVAGQQPDVCGLKVATAHLVLTGGYSFFHNPVPLYGYDGPGRDSGLINYEITSAGPDVPDATVVASDGQVVLLRLATPACAPDPGYDWRLPGFPAFN